MHVGNLYYYFQNKQELLAYCQGQTLSSLIELAERIRRQSWHADEKLYRLISGHVVSLNEEMPGSLAHLEVEALDDPWKMKIVKQRNRYESLVRQLIQEGNRTGVFRPTDPGVSAKAILGAANWTVKWYSPQGARTSQEIGREFASLLVRGLLAPDRKPSLPELRHGSQDSSTPGGGED